MSADLIITVVIIYGLTRSKTGWVNTDRVSSKIPSYGLTADEQTIAKLIRLTFESQMPPTLISLAFMIEFSKLVRLDRSMKLICSHHSLVPPWRLFAGYSIQVLRSRTHVRPQLPNQVSTNDWRYTDCRCKLSLVGISTKLTLRAKSLLFRTEVLLRSRSTSRPMSR